IGDELHPALRRFATKVEFLPGGRDPGMEFVFFFADTGQGQRRSFSRLFHQVEILEVLELLVGYLVLREVQRSLKKERTARIPFDAPQIHFASTEYPRGV